MQPPYPSQNQHFEAKPYNPSGMQQQYAPKQQQFQPPGFQQQSAEQSELEELRLMVKSLVVSQKTLENQLGQLASAMLSRPQGSLPSNTETNPAQRDGTEHVKAITLRSGTTTSGPEIEKEAEPEADKLDNSENAQISGSSENSVLKNQPTQKNSAQNQPPSEGNFDQDQPAKKSTQSLVDPPIYPPPPFPQRL
jgi:hypothetical protein